MCGFVRFSLSLHIQDFFSPFPYNSIMVANGCQLTTFNHHKFMGANEGQMSVVDLMVTTI